MLSIAPARLRGRIPRAVLAAAVAACALPAAAQAATVEMSADGTTLIHRGASGEINSLNVRVVDGAVEVQDFAGLTSRTPLCTSVTSGRVRCAIGVPKRIHALLGDRNDSTSIRVGIPAIVEGGAGDDSFTAGNGPDPSNIAYHGGFGLDTVTYRFADRGVRVNSTSSFTADGRKNFDQDNVMDDVETIHGSEFDDELLDFAENAFSSRSLVGRQGNDTLRAGIDDHIVRFGMGPARDGADLIAGGRPGYSILDYSMRTQPLTLTLNHGNGNDGEPGEGDTVVGNFGIVLGGQAGDSIRLQPGTTNGTYVTGGAGGDTLEGAEGPDTLQGDGGVDTLLGNGGSDFLDADDGLAGEIVGCGTEIDSASLDPGDGHTSCENRTVGVLRLSPKTSRAQAGEPVTLRLGWRHPRAWKHLRSIELRLTQRGVPVGEVTIRPRAKRITADGAVELLRKQTRLTRNGKTVTARLAVRLDESLAGRTLTADVEATDRRGARQLERDAGTVRVAR